MLVERNLLDDFKIFKNCHFDSDEVRRRRKISSDSCFHNSLLNHFTTMNWRIFLAEVFINCSSCEKKIFLKFSLTLQIVHSKNFQICAPFFIRKYVLLLPWEISYAVSHLFSSVLMHLSTRDRIFNQNLQLNTLKKW